jgi:branched-chain amino acid transport system ATP-binding protein
VSAPALSTRGLGKSFGSLVVANDITVELPRGERYALIGPNGAGKTTLINLMTGMLKPDRGQIFLGPDEITSLPPAQRVRRGLVRTFQINTLFPHLNALEAVTLAVCERLGCAGQWWRKLPSYGEAIEEAHAILLSLQLGSICYRATHELAYGQQRLLEIARALATRPRLLMLDEPAAGVNPTELHHLAQIIRDIKKAGVTLLVIEHHMELIMGISDAISVLDFGQKIAEGSVATVREDKKVIEAYLGVDETADQVTHA